MSAHATHRRTQSSPATPNIIVEDRSAPSNPAPHELGEAPTSPRRATAPASEENEFGHAPHRRRSTHRKASPGVEWREPWTSEKFANGRVLLIDYIAKGMGPTP